MLSRGYLHWRVEIIIVYPVPERQREREKKNRRSEGAAEGGLYGLCGRGGVVWETRYRARNYCNFRTALGLFLSLCVCFIFGGKGASGLIIEFNGIL